MPLAAQSLELPVPYSFPAITTRECCFPYIWRMLQKSTVFRLKESAWLLLPQSQELAYFESGDLPKHHEPLHDDFHAVTDRN